MGVHSIVAYHLQTQMAVSALLDLKCDANLQNNHGATALHYGATSVEILELLKNKVGLPLLRLEVYTVWWCSVCTPIPTYDTANSFLVLLLFWLKMGTFEVGLSKSRSHM